MSFVKIINVSNFILISSINLAKLISLIGKFSDTILIKMLRSLSYPLLFMAQGQTTCYTYVTVNVKREALYTSTISSGKWGKKSP